VLAGHSNLRTTERYIDPNPEAQLRIVELVWGKLACTIVKDHQLTMPLHA
jgi:hypothetical protein